MSRAARSTGWQSRAAHLRGEVALDPAWTLSASEIGAYAFCRQAWFLQRRLHGRLVRLGGHEDHRRLVPMGMAAHVF